MSSWLVSLAMDLTLPLESFQRPAIRLYPEPGETEHIRTLIEVIEFNAQANPDHLFCLQAKKNPGSPVPWLVSVSNHQLKTAISRCATWLRANLQLQLPTVAEDGSVTKGAPVALLMESDIGLLLYEMALIGLGVPVLLLSARLSATAIQSLLQRTSASAIIASRRLESTAREAAQALPVYSPLGFETLLASQEGLLDSCSICHPYHHISESDRDVLILHSSGTTGMPKPIYVSHRHLLSFVNCHNLYLESEAQGVNLSTLPLYHGFGLVAPALAMGVGKTVCFPPGSTVPSAGATLDLLKISHAASFMTVPSILEDITSMGPEGIQALARLDFVTFGGGILKPAVGKCLVGYGVRLLNHYGTTESGPLAPIFVPSDNYNWRFFRLRDDLRLQLQEIAPEGNERRFKLTTFPFGWGQPFEIQDQLVCNPDHPESDFNAVGRNDDTIVLATGEKVQPQILEATLSECSLVKSAIAFGEHQFEIGVLVQPTADLAPDQYTEFKQELWPLVLAASQKMDGHARIQSSEAILVVPSTVMLPRTDKGSIARRDVYTMFEAEIALVYRNLESAGLVQSLNWQTLEHDLKTLISSCVDWGSDWHARDDLFERGMNSLQAIRVQRTLVVAVTRSLQGVCRPERIGRDFVYSHPSVRAMARFFRNIVSGRESGDVVTDSSIEVDHFVQKFALPSTKANLLETPKAVVLLTGATGSLGSHCLVSLTLSPSVGRVICLVRSDSSSTDAVSRLQRSLEAKQLRLGENQWSMVDVIECSTSNKHLGLTAAQYTALQQSVTHILHTAWPMDFNWKLPSFQCQFQTLHNLLILGRQIHEERPRIKPRLTFLSSIATVGQYAHVHGVRMVPESPVDSVECLNPIGYAEAKLVCERMLEHARENHASAVEVSYIRMGQIAGSSATGFWNVNEHFPALVRSSQRIGWLPQLPNTLSWIPVDQAAASVTELLLSSTASDLVYHVENPIRQPWYDMLEIIGAELNIPLTLPWDQWLQRVSRTDDEGNPAKKLSDFFAKDFLRMACGEVIMGTDAARGVSATLRGSDGVTGGTVRGYLQYWRDVGWLKEYD
ncbi:hypothetical protein BJX76DRAFT_357597 [Aspergillus varians]